jgi:hypothetical protein
MKIQFLPHYEMAEALHVLTDTVWKYGEIKDIPDDATFRTRVNGETLYLRVIDDLLSSSNFVVAESKKNPNYVCVECGHEALDAAFITPFDTILADQDSGRICSDCFKNPKSQKSEESEKE